VVGKFRAAGATAAICALLAVGLAACSSSAGSGAGGSRAGSSGGSSSGGSSIVAEAAANVEQDFANNGAAFSLPPVSNPNALKGKTVMYLSAGLSSPGGTAGLKAIQEVQAKLGFRLVPYDGQFTPSKYQEGMRQAVAQHVDVLMLYGVDCPGNEAALKQVHAAGIKIVGDQSVDCNEMNPSAQGLFDGQPLYPANAGKSRKIADVWAASDGAQADYLISKLKGNVKVIQFVVPDFAVTAAGGKGFAQRISECDACKIVDTVQVGVSDFGSGLQQKAEQALLQHPEANAVEVPYDDLMTLGVAAAIQSSGRTHSMQAVAGGGNAPYMDLIRKDQGLNAGWVESYGWDHWAGIDTAIRLLSSQQPVVDGIPVILYDKDHNIPPSGAFVVGVEFRSVFEKAWGLK
jgi:ribose transport system substrate-binding protein